MDKPWKVIFAFIGVFIAGAVFGGLFTLRASAKRTATELALSQPAKSPTVAVQTKQEAAQATPPAAEPAPAAAPQPARTAPTPQERNATLVMRELTKRVTPTADQRDKMRVIVARVTEDIQRSQRDHWQEVTRINDRMYEDLSAVLSPEQRIQLERMRQEILERNRNAKEKQRLEAQAKGAAVRPNVQGQPPAPSRKPGAAEGANPPR